MKINIVYKKEKEWFIGHIQEYPDYESQGKTVDELKENLIEIYNDINKGLVPDAEPFQLLEVAISKGPEADHWALLIGTGASNVVQKIII
jgi:predicted RNase H-like HicB family nuclease